MIIDGFVSRPLDRENRHRRRVSCTNDPLSGGKLHVRSNATTVGPDVLRGHIMVVGPVVRRNSGVLGGSSASRWVNVAGLGERVSS